MGCTRPLVRFNSGGVWRVKSLDGYIGKDNPEWYKNSQRQELLAALKEGQAQILPCGKCLACKLQYSARWADRCVYELPYHKQSWFVTITYDDNNIPIYQKSTNQHYKGIKNLTGYNAGTNTDERATLEWDDFTKYVKRLRIEAWREKEKRLEKYTPEEIEKLKALKNLNEKYEKYYKTAEKMEFYKPIRIFACGEYGTKTARPHYHLIVYGLNFAQDELKHYKYNHGYEYFNVDWLSQRWPYGYTVVGAVEWDCCAYVARYVMKKQGDKIDFKSAGIAEEDIRMSTNPGIGFWYYIDHIEDIYTGKDQIVVPNGKGRTVKPPRYFDKLFDNDMLGDFAGIETSDAEGNLVKAESIELQEIKRARRKKANDALFEQLKQTNVNLETFFKQQDQLSKKAFSNTGCMAQREKFI